MNLWTELAERRIAARAAQLDAIATAAERSGATALHIIGSLGRQEDDALSDVDAWLTFPDDAIAAVVRDRLDLYRELGEILLMHEAVNNRPIGGVYSLVLYQSEAGPMMVDWALAPQRTSSVVPPMKTVYEQVPVPRVAHFSQRQIDSAAQPVYTLDERVTWLTCMLFVAIKMILRRKDLDFLPFLEEGYRDGRDTYRFDGIAVTRPTSLPNVSIMLRQLIPYARDEQRRAIEAIDSFLRQLAETWLSH
jgi:hypothetical protein